MYGKWNGKCKWNDFIKWFYFTMCNALWYILFFSVLLWPLKITNHIPLDLFHVQVFGYMLNFEKHYSLGAFLVAQLVRNLPAVQETWVQSLGWEDTLEKEMATHSSILAWKISWTEEPGWVQPMGRKESGTTEQLTLTYLHLLWFLENYEYIFLYFVLPTTVALISEKDLS